MMRKRSIASIVAVAGLLFLGTAGPAAASSWNGTPYIAECGGTTNFGSTSSWIGKNSSYASTTRGNGCVGQNLYVSIDGSYINQTTTDGIIATTTPWQAARSHHKLASFQVSLPV